MRIIEMENDFQASVSLESPATVTLNLICSWSKPDTLGGFLIIIDVIKDDHKYHYDIPTVELSRRTVTPAQLEGRKTTVRAIAPRTLLIISLLF